MFTLITETACDDTHLKIEMKNYDEKCENEWECLSKIKKYVFDVLLLWLFAFLCLCVPASKKKVKLKTSEQNEAHRLLKLILIILEIVDCAFF